jgi:hypothetical protein
VECFFELFFGLNGDSSGANVEVLACSTFVLVLDKQQNCSIWLISHPNRQQREEISAKFRIIFMVKIIPNP